jgi:hypothetical protein
LKAKLDENMPHALADFLLALGIDVHTTAQESLNGADDGRILNAAKEEGRTLFTFDTDFADIRTYPPSSHAGVVVFSLQDQRWASMEPHVRSLVDSHHLETLTQCLAIVDESRVRIRR